MQNLQLLKVAFLISTFAISHAGWTTLQDLPKEVQLGIYDYVGHENTVLWFKLKSINRKNRDFLKKEEERYIYSKMKQLDENEQKLLEVFDQLKALAHLSLEKQANALLEKIFMLEQTRSPNFPNPFNLKYDELKYEKDPLLLRKIRLIQSEKKNIQEFNQKIKQILQEAEPLLQTYQNVIFQSLLKSIPERVKHCHSLTTQFEKDKIILERLRSRAEKLNAVEILRKVETNLEQNQTVKEIISQYIKIFSKYSLRLLGSKNLLEAQGYLEEIHKELKENNITSSRRFWEYRFSFNELVAPLTEEERFVLERAKYFYTTNFPIFLNKKRRKINQLERKSTAKQIPEDLKNSVQQLKESLEKLQKDHSAILLFFLPNEERKILERNNIESLLALNQKIESLTYDNIKAFLELTEKFQTIKIDKKNSEAAMNKFISEFNVIWKSLKLI